MVSEIRVVVTTTARTPIVHIRRSSPVCTAWDGRVVALALIESEAIAEAFFQPQPPRVRELSDLRNRHRDRQPAGGVRMAVGTAKSSTWRVAALTAAPRDRLVTTRPIGWWTLDPASTLSRMLSHVMAAKCTALH